jgi:hypothetical protein
MYSFKTENFSTISPLRFELDTLEASSWCQQHVFNINAL